MAATTTDASGEERAARIAALQARRRAASTERADANGPEPVVTEVATERTPDQGRSAPRAARRRRPRPATTARVLATGLAVTATGLLVAAMGAARPASPVPAPPPVTTPPPTPPVIVVVQESASAAPAPATGSAGTAQAAPVPVTPTTPPAPVATSTAS